MTTSREFTTSDGDADLHEPILAGGKDVSDIGRRAAKDAGLTEAELEALYGPPGQ